MSRADRRRRADRRAAARHPVAGQRRASARRRHRPAGCCPTSCATTSRLTGTHVGCEHGVCGACTVLVDGQPMRSCLMFAVSAQAHEITTVEGIGNDPEAMSPVQQAFAECHGAAVRLLHPGLPHDDHRLPRREPRPDAARRPARRSRATCAAAPGYQNIVKAVCRAAEIRRDGPAQLDRPVPGDEGGVRPMSTRQFGEQVQRREDPRLLTGNGRYLDDLGHDALAAAFVRSPHAHARIVDIDIDDAWEVDGVEAIYTWDDLTGRVAEPLPVLIPHPALTHARTGYCLAKDEVNHVGEAVVMVVARDRYVAEDAAAAHPGHLRAAARRRRHRARPRRRRRSCTTTCPATSAPTCCRRSATSSAAMAAAPHTAHPRPRRSSAAPACRWRARASTPGGTLDERLAAPLLLHPDLDRRARRRRRQARDAARQGRVHRPRRGRRVRRQDHAPVARGGARAVGGPQPRPRRSSGPRTAASTSSPARTSAGSCRRSPSASTTRAACSPST